MPNFILERIATFCQRVKSKFKRNKKCHSYHVDSLGSGIENPHHFQNSIIKIEDEIDDRRILVYSDEEHRDSASFFRTAERQRSMKRVQKPLVDLNQEFGVTKGSLLDQHLERKATQSRRGDTLRRIKSRVDDENLLSSMNDTPVQNLRRKSMRRPDDGGGEIEPLRRKSTKTQNQVVEHESIRRKSVKKIKERSNTTEPKKKYYNESEILRKLSHKTFDEQENISRSKSRAKIRTVLNGVDNVDTPIIRSPRANITSVGKLDYISRSPRANSINERPKSKSYGSNITDDLEFNDRSPYDLQMKRVESYVASVVDDLDSIIRNPYPFGPDLEMKRVHSYGLDGKHNPILYSKKYVNDDKTMLNRSKIKDNRKQESKFLSVSDDKTMLNRKSSKNKNEEENIKGKMSMERSGGLVKNGSRRMVSDDKTMLIRKSSNNKNEEENIKVKMSMERFGRSGSLVKSVSSLSNSLRKSRSSRVCLDDIPLRHLEDDSMRFF
jgi:hypothetical protein